MSTVNLRSKLTFLLMELSQIGDVWMAHVFYTTLRLINHVFMLISSCLNYICLTN